ncbi:hypothetical protein HYC85_018001 [Camellia sinensis]|uniref:GB1/RHD3-type G domain-containing protein n=1 Tax=Camellia sinensis TaxID=4442 RepID=A0A7J7GWR8_CAMSI|nr:hypothetical protein HYC85_018001 [Camellia sinensis]
MGQQSLIYSFVAKGTVVLAEPIRFSSAPSFFSYQIHGLLKLSQIEEGSESCSTHLIEGDGTFNFAGIENFLKEVKLAECGLSSQTTKGIWLAKCSGIEPCTLVMDLEGTDGRERGEDDTAFEKQSALFALAVSDIMLINIYMHCNQLKFMMVMMRLFSPRKTTLMFVIRDKTRTPLENLEPVLREDIQKVMLEPVLREDIQKTAEHPVSKRKLKQAFCDGTYTVAKGREYN